MQTHAALNLVGIRETHCAALQSTAAGLVAEFGQELLGIIVGGSVGRGHARPDSDLDLFVLVAVPWSQRRRGRASGIEIDVFIDPAIKVRHLIRNVKNPVVIENYATGLIVWDRDAATAALARQANEVYGGRRNELPDTARFSLQERAKDLMLAVERAVDDSCEDSAKYLLSCLLVHCINAYYEVNRLWDPPAKRRIAQLRESDRQFSNAVEALLAESMPMQRRVSVARWMVTQLFGEETFEESHSLIGPQIPYVDDSALTE